jgi:hypothetical protein
VKTMRIAVSGRVGRVRAFTFFEVITTMILAAIIALIAAVSFDWVVLDTKAKIVRMDANEFERAVRSVANTELRSPTTADATVVAQQMTEEETELTISDTGNGYQLSRNGETACVTLGEGINTRGTVTDGPCS